MTRIKRGYVAKKRRKKILNFTKGFQGSHSKLFRTANEQYMKSFKYSYFDRRKNKTKFKNLWISRINAASRSYGTSYNKVLSNLKKNKIALNRKILAEIILKDKRTFTLLLNKL